MSKLNDGLASRTRLTDRDVWFYEDSIARQLSIMDEIRGITLDVTDADLLELIARRLANITELAGQTRRALIEHRDSKQGVGEP